MQTIDAVVVAAAHDGGGDSGCCGDDNDDDRRRSRLRLCGDGLVVVGKAMVTVIVTMIVDCL